LFGLKDCGIKRAAAKDSATPATDLCNPGVGGHLLNKQQRGVSKESPKFLNRFN
jgi:hypothetical protein